MFALSPFTAHTTEQKIEKLCQTAHDDIEMYFGYNLLAQKLSFSHLSFVIAQDVNDEEEETESTEKSDEFFQFRVGSHVFEGKIQKIKKIKQ